MFARQGICLCSADHDLCCSVILKWLHIIGECYQYMPCVNGTLANLVTGTQQSVQALVALEHYDSIWLPALIQTTVSTIWQHYN